MKIIGKSGCENTKGFSYLLKWDGLELHFFYFKVEGLKDNKEDSKGKLNGIQARKERDLVEEELEIGACMHVTSVAGGQALNEDEIKIPLPSKTQDIHLLIRQTLSLLSCHITSLFSGPYLWDFVF